MIMIIALNAKKLKNVCARTSKPSHIIMIILIIRIKMKFALFRYGIKAFES
jgi:hypothetical protein